MTPAWILDAIAALMLVVAAVSAARLVAARPWRRGAVIVDTDVAHLLMAIAMAGMAVPGLGTLPDVAWEVAFGLLAAWFAGRVLADARRSGIRALAGGHCAPHLAHSGSMLYMFLAASPAATSASGMSGMSRGPDTGTMALSHPTLAFACAFVLVGYAIWDLDQLSGRRYATRAPVSLAGAGAGGTVGMAMMTDTPSLPALPPGTAPADAAPDTGQAAAAGAERAAPAREEHATVSSGAGAARIGGPHPGGGGAFLLSPAVTVGCRITMSIAMAFMLLIAL
jgi:hypothetical protein